MSHATPRATLKNTLWLLIAGLSLSGCGTAIDATTPVSAPSTATTSELNSFDTIELLSHEIILDPAGTANIEVPQGWRHIRKLTLQAEGIRQDAMFEVIVNDTVKGTIHVPGRDPAYVVTIAEGARTITLRHTEGGSVRITSIGADVSRFSTHPHEGHGPVSDHARSQVAELAYRTIQLSDDFHRAISVDDWETSVLPIKIAAGRTYALARASGDLSGRVRTALIAMLAQIGLAEPFIDRALQNEATFDQAVELLTMRNTIEDLLN